MDAKLKESQEIALNSQKELQNNKEIHHMEIELKK